MKKILITGGAGFIGSHLVDHLLAQGVSPKQLRLIVLSNESLANLPADQNIEILRGDIRNRRLIKRAMKEVSVVYHLAARIDFDGKTYSEYKDVNVDATHYLLDAAIKEKVKKFIFFSSIGVHGLPADRGNIINFNENTPGEKLNFYGQSKWEGEKLVREASQKHGLAYAIIRPASVYGPREKGPTLALYQAIKNKRFLIIGSGQNKLHYVYVTDLVAAARLAEKSRLKSGVYIIGGANPTTLNQLATFIAQSINTSLLPLKLPTVMALPLSYVLDMLGKITGLRSPLFPSRVRTMTTTYYYSINKARHELGYSPKVTIKEGTKRTGRWYLDQGWL